MYDNVCLRYSILAPNIVPAMVQNQPCATYTVVPYRAAGAIGAVGHHAPLHAARDDENGPEFVTTLTPQPSGQEHFV